MSKESICVFLIHTFLWHCSASGTTLQPHFDRKFEKGKVMQYLTVVAMTGLGIGLMLGGCLAWIVGEELLLVTAFVSGAVFVGAGGIGFMKCLDDLKL